MMKFQSIVDCHLLSYFCQSHTTIGFTQFSVTTRCFLAHRYYLYQLITSLAAHHQSISSSLVYQLITSLSAHHQSISSSLAYQLITSPSVNSSLVYQLITSLSAHHQSISSSLVYQLITSLSAHHQLICQFTKVFAITLLFGSFWVYRTGLVFLLNHHSFLWGKQATRNGWMRFVYI